MTDHVSSHYSVGARQRTPSANRVYPDLKTQAAKSNLHLPCTRTGKAVLVVAGEVHRVSSCQIVRFSLLPYCLPSLGCP